MITINRGPVELHITGPDYTSVCVRACVGA